jgi:hypothetical protein
LAFFHLVHGPLRNFAGIVIDVFLMICLPLFKAFSLIVVKSIGVGGRLIEFGLIVFGVKGLKCGIRFTLLGG